MVDVKTYQIPAPLMQQIVNVLTALPWATANNVIVPLMQVIEAQDNPPSAE